MKKTIQRVLAIILMANLAFSFGCGDSSQTEKTNDVTLKVANSSDKILQFYSEYSTIKDKFMGNLVDDFAINAYQNEYESKQLILTAEKDISSFDVEIEDFKKGDKTLDKSNFTVYQEYYHNVHTIYGNYSQMEAGYFPDALIPMDVAKEYKINQIKQGNNQGIYITVYVPKGQEAGTYTGKITVKLNDKDVKTVEASITVLDYELPDKVSLASCIPVQGAYIANGELDSTIEMYEKYVEHLNNYRLSTMFLDPNGLKTGLTDEAYYDSAIKEAEMAVAAAQDETVSAYAIHYLGESSGEFNGKEVLSENVFDIYMRAYIDKSIESGVDLFKKAYVYFGSIIDEPYLTNSEERANYVCRQVEDRVAAAVKYAEAQGASEELKASVAGLRHVVTNAWSLDLGDVPYYCPQPDDLDSADKLDLYENLYKQGKGFWWYTCCIPYQPYPTVHIDDNGTAMRLMGWMARKYDIGGYLTWESAYYMTYDGISTSSLYGYDNYTVVERWTGGFGDGYCFYPGALFGLDEPIDSIRLPIMRDGMEEYEALTDLQNLYEEMSDSFGTDISYDGVLNELYTYLFNRVKCNAESSEVDEMHVVLGRLLELAKKGVAISDFKVNFDKTISCKIYSKENVNLKINGMPVSFVSTQNGFVADVKTDTVAFFVESAVNNFEIPVGESVYSDTLKDKASSIVFADVNQQVITDATANVERVPSSDTDALHFNFDKDCSLIMIPLQKGSLSSDVRKITLQFYSDVKMTATLIVQAGNKGKNIDSFVIHEGLNTIELSRIQDLNLGNILDSVDKMYLSFVVDSDDNDVYLLGMSAVK